MPTKHSRPCPNCGRPMSRYYAKQCRACWRSVRPLIDNGDGTHTVILTRGKTALIDSVDAPRVSTWNWFMGGNGYAGRTLSGGGTEYLHRFILDAGDGEFVDHINRNRLDCRRTNLRTATWAQNVTNSGREPGPSSYRGVTLRCDKKKWVAKVHVDGKAVHLGSFPTPEAAAQAYDAAAIEHFGEYARVNFPH